MANVVNFPSGGGGGGLNILPMILSQQLGLQSSRQLMRERAGLTEAMDVRKEEREQGQRWEAERDQASIVDFRDKFNMTDANVDARNDYLNTETPTLWNNLSPRTQKVRFGGDMTNLRLTLERPLSPKEHESLVEKQARLSPKAAVKRRELTGERARITADRTFARQTQIDLLNKRVQTLDPNLTSEQAEKQLRRFARDLGLPKKYVESLKRTDARQHIKNEAIKNANAQIANNATKRSSNATKMANLIKVIPKYPAGGTAQQGYLQAVLQNAVQQKALHETDKALALKIGIEDKSQYLPDPATLKIFVAKKANDPDGDYDRSKLFWHGDTLGKAGKRQLEAAWSKFMVGRVQPISLYELLKGQTPSSAVQREVPEAVPTRGEFEAADLNPAEAREDATQAAMRDATAGYQSPMASGRKYTPGSDPMKVVGDVLSRTGADLSKALGLTQVGMSSSSAPDAKPIPATDFQQQQRIAFIRNTISNVLPDKPAQVTDAATVLGQSGITIEDLKTAIKTKGLHHTEKQVVHRLLQELKRSNSNAT
mgnify:CR=1 FL=1